MGVRNVLTPAAGGRMLATADDSDDRHLARRTIDGLGTAAVEYPCTRCLHAAISGAFRFLLIFNVKTKTKLWLTIHALFSSVAFWFCVHGRCHFISVGAWVGGLEYLFIFRSRYLPPPPPTPGFLTPPFSAATAVSCVRRLCNLIAGRSTSPARCTGQSMPTLQRTSTISPECLRPR